MIWYDMVWYMWYGMVVTFVVFKVYRDITTASHGNIVLLKYAQEGTKVQESSSGPLRVGEEAIHDSETCII